MQTKEHLTTNEIAAALGVQGATVRRGLCVHGHYMGLKPVKMPNNRLLWPVEGLKNLLRKEVNAEA